jgi:hypothetical protein
MTVSAEKDKNVAAGKKCDFAANRKFYPATSSS